MSATLTLSASWPRTDAFASWPLPQAIDLAGAYALAYRDPQAFPGSNPDEANSFMAVTARTHGIVGFGLYLYQRALADELMLDTAQQWLPRHASQWGVPRIPPTPAIGPVVFSLPGPGIPLPQGIEVVRQDGTQWITTAPATTGADGTATVSVQAELPGLAGNVPASTALTVISPIPGLQNQSVVVAAGGIAGGDDIEGVESWRARILLRARKRGQAGSASDYVQWAEAAGAAPTPNVIARYAGPATIGVVVALPNPAGLDRLVPTPTEVAAIAASIERVRPVTDEVIVLAAIALPQPVTLALSPDTVVGRVRAAAAVSAFLAAVPIGGLLVADLLQDAAIQAAGAAVELLVPAANVQAEPLQMFSTGAVSFVQFA